MSKTQLRFARRAVSILTATATAATIGGSAFLGLAVAPADFGLNEGDTISANAQTGDPDVYIVNEHGFKRLFVNPQIFNLYGHLGFDTVKSVSAATRDAFGTSGLFRNCESGDEKVYGLDVISEDVANLRWVNTSGAQAVADDPDFFKKVFCINNAEQGLYGSGADYTSVSQVPDYARGDTGGPSGPLGASLASENPAATTILETQALAPIAAFNITGSGQVNKVVLQKLGIAGDATLSNVYLFVGGMRKSDGFTFSDNTLTFNNPNGYFNAPATLWVRANVADSTSGQTIGVGLYGVNDTSFTVNGNTHSIAANPSDLSTVSVGTPSGGGDLDPQPDVKVWESDLAVSGNDVWLKRLSLRMIGSANQGDFTNFKLFVDGVQVATAVGLDADDYVHFLVNHKIKTSDPAILKVNADIVGGSNRTYQFSLRGAYDLEVVDADYSAGVIPTGTFPAAPASGTIGVATLTIVKASNSPSGDVVSLADDVEFALYNFRAFGEDIKIETLSVRASVSTSAFAPDTNVGTLRDGRIMVGTDRNDPASFVQYGSTISLSRSASNSFTLNYVLKAGQEIWVSVRADAYDNAGDNDLGAGDRVAILLDGNSSSNNAQGVSSGTQIDAPGSRVKGNILTIVTGASPILAEDLSYPDQTIVLPQGLFNIGRWNLTAPSTEGINLTSFVLDVDEVTGSTFNQSDINNLYIQYGSKVTQTKGTLSSDGQDNTFNISSDMTANETIAIKAYAKLLDGNVTSLDSFKTDLDVVGTAKTSGASLTVSETDGQTVTFGAGSLTSVRDTNVANNDFIVGDEQTVTAAGFEFTAVNETYTLSVLNFNIANATGITEVRVMDGTTLVQSLPASTDLTFNIPSANRPVVTPSSTKKLTVDLVLSTIASPGGTASGVNHSVDLDSSQSKALAGSSGVEAVLTSADAEGKNVYTYKAIPTVTRLALSSTVLGSGGGLTKTIAKFNVGSGGTGTIGWIKTILDFTNTGTTASLAMSQIKFYNALDESTQISGTVSSTSTQITFVAVDEQAAGDYVVKAVINDDTTGTNDVITVTWAASGLGFVAPTASSSVGGTASFVWTDRFSLPHTESTPDWNNDNLVKNLPLDSWSLVE